MSQLFKEIEKGNVTAIKKMLSINPNLVHTTTPTDNRLPLHAAAMAGQASIVQYLLMFETKYDAQDSQGSTPLHLACKSGSVETVRPLLSSGRRTALRVRNKDGQTPLHVAVKCGCTQVVKELLSMGAKTDLKDKEGNTALDLLPEDCRELIPALSETSSTTAAVTPNNASRNLYYVSPRNYIRHTSPRSASGRNSITSLDRSINSSPSFSIMQMSMSPEKGRPVKPVQNSRNGRKHIQLHEVAIQGLQSELQDLGRRVDAIEEIFDDNQEIFDCANRFYIQVETQDRQLAELDQRLKFQEAHMRELRPQVSTLSDETRCNKEQTQHAKKMVDLLKDAVRDVMDKVEQRIKEWENNTSRWSDEDRTEMSMPDPEHEMRDEIKNLEKQIADATNVIKEVKTSMANNASFHTCIETKLEEVQGRIVHVENMVVAAAAKRREKEKQEEAAMKQQMTDLTRKLERLQIFVDKTAGHIDRVENLYCEQMRLENSRKAEQEKELSQRESRILDLRRVALEEEQQRRDLFYQQEQQKSLMESLIAKVEAMEASAAEVKKENESLKDQIKDLEGMHNQLKEKVIEQELKKKKKSCWFSRRK